MNRSANAAAPTCRVALLGALLGMSGASAAPAEPAPSTRPSPGQDEASPRFPGQEGPLGCGRYPTACLPAHPHGPSPGQHLGIGALPQLSPTVEVDPRISRLAAALGTGLVLRSTWDLAAEPGALDPLRTTTPAQREMVGILTISDQLGELAQPGPGASGDRPTPRAWSGAAGE